MSEMIQDNNCFCTGYTLSLNRALLSTRALKVAKVIGSSDDPQYLSTAFVLTNLNSTEINRSLGVISVFGVTSFSHTEKTDPIHCYVTIVSQCPKSASSACLHSFEAKGVTPM